MFTVLFPLLVLTETFCFRHTLGRTWIDDARLATLFLTMPISWRGTLRQCVARLYQIHENKKEVLVYDYADTLVPMPARTYRKRTAGYSSLGYIVADGTR